jgi:hypothetical protein
MFRRTQLKENEDTLTDLPESRQFNRRDRRTSNEEGLLDREETNTEERGRESKEGRRMAGTGTYGWHLVRRSGVGAA